MNEISANTSLRCRPENPEILLKKQQNHNRPKIKIRNGKKSQIRSEFFDPQKFREQFFRNYVKSPAVKFWKRPDGVGSSNGRRLICQSPELRQPGKLMLHIILARDYMMVVHFAFANAKTSLTSAYRAFFV